MFQKKSDGDYIPEAVANQEGRYWNLLEYIGNYLPGNSGPLEVPHRKKRLVHKSEEWQSTHCSPAVEVPAALHIPAAMNRIFGVKLIIPAPGCRLRTVHNHEYLAIAGLLFTVIRRIFFVENPLSLVFALLNRL